MYSFILAISKDKAFIEGVHKHRHDPEKRAQFASEYASKKWGMTASLKVKAVDGAGVVDQEVKSFERADHPAGKRYSEVQDKDQDANDMLHAVQMHKCNGYCMRLCKKDKRKGLADLVVELKLPRTCATLLASASILSLSSKKRVEREPCIFHATIQDSFNHLWWLLRAGEPTKMSASSCTSLTPTNRMCRRLPG